MSLQGIPAQTAFFYSDGWSGELDNYFLCSLVDYKVRLKWGGNTPPRPVLASSRVALNVNFGLELTTDELGERVKLLHKRYKTFKKVINTKGAIHLSGDNFVSATTPTWLKIFAHDPFAQAYYREAEPEWHQLLILFGPNLIKQEGEEHVIVISDNTNDMHVNYVGDEGEDTEEDEVTSPVANATRRRLFPEESHTFDQQLGFYGGAVMHGNVYP